LSVVSREGAEVVSVYDDAGSSVTGATVYIDIELNDQPFQSVSPVTNGNGVAKYSIRRPAKGTYTVTVTDVSHGTFTYEPDANKETTDSYTVT